MRKIALFLALILVFFALSACSKEEKKPQTPPAVSYGDENDDWKLSLLANFGLQHIEEPEGEKVFTSDEKGNVTFAVTPATTETLEGLSASIFTKIGNVCSETTPFTYSEALSKDKTHFKMNYVLEGEKITVEMNLDGNILTSKIIGQ